MNETITYGQWDLAVVRAFKAEMRRAGRAISRGSITLVCRSYIVETRPDTETLLVKEGWRLAIKEAANASL